MKHTKKVFILLILTVFMAYLLGYANTEKETAVNKTKMLRKQAVEKTNILIDEAEKFKKSKNYQQALDRYRRIIQLIYQFKFNNNFLIAMLQNQNDIAIKVGEFKEALEAAKRIEKIDREFFKRQSPFYAFRVAETYAYLNQAENAMKWLEKSVYKRGFNRMAMLLESKLQRFKDRKRFKLIVKKINANLGIGQEAKKINLYLLDGSKLNLDMLKGKVVLIDFWAQWCPPCIKEINHMKSYYPELKKKGFEILAISLDTNRQKFQAFLKKNRDINWLLACTFEGWKTEAVKTYQITGIPSVWLIDRKGVLRYFNLRGKALINRIRTLLDEV